MRRFRFSVLVLSATVGAMVAAAPAAAQARDTAAARLAGGEPWKTDFTRVVVPSGEIVSGGPPRDGIPSLDRPRFVDARSAGGWLGDRDPVIVVEHDGAARGYPLGILVWHEIVNDRMAGLPFAVTFCPLCNTALVFDRRVGSRVLDFGTTGRLRHSDLVMYDRQTESWWQQATGEAIVGALAGQRLRRVPSTTLAWKEARTLYPDIQVLSRETGFRRDYGRNPYVGYDNVRGSPLAGFFGREPDPRLPPMQRVAAVELGAGWATPLEVLQRKRVLNGQVDEVPFVLAWMPGAASALDAREITSGRDIGQTAAFDRRVAGRTLTFVPSASGFADHETGTRWDLAGRAVQGPLRGARLRPVLHDTPFWFAWAVFKPHAHLWQP